jgi:hypothetical protein
VFERATNSWMKTRRAGMCAIRFDKHPRHLSLPWHEGYQEPTSNARRTILEAYRDFRGALKQSEVMALEVLKKAEWKLEEAKKKLNEASAAVANFAGTEPSERAKLELIRDEVLRPDAG